MFGSHLLWIKNMEEKVLGMKSNQCERTPFPTEMRFTRWLCLCLLGFSSHKFRPVGYFDQIQHGVSQTQSP